MKKIIKDMVILMTILNMAIIMRMIGLIPSSRNKSTSEIKTKALKILSISIPRKTRKMLKVSEKKWKTFYAKEIKCQSSFLAFASKLILWIAVGQT